MDERFVPGLTLARRFHADAVAPLLQAHFPDVVHSAGRLGNGSEVLGFDTPRSADHEWGPRVQVFLSDDERAPEIVAMLADRLPKQFMGYPTNFAATGEDHVRFMRHTDGPVFHRVEVTGIGTWFGANLGFDPRDGVTTGDWLATPTQTLAVVTGGAVFHDGLGELVAMRSALSWYPPDLWRHVLACQWERISQEEAFVGRCGEVGDELGSAVVAARLVRDLMRLCLLMDRRYPPYSKWLGSAFARLPVAARLAPVLTAVVAATAWKEREAHLVAAYGQVAAVHNALALTDPLDTTTSSYHNRPFQVLHAGRFAAALLAGVTDPAVLRLPPIGAIDQYTDSTDVVERRQLCRDISAAAIGTE